MSASDQDISENICDNSFDNIESQDLLEYLDDFIPADLREDYLKLLSGITIPANRKEKLKDIINPYKVECGCGVTRIPRKQYMRVFGTPAFYTYRCVICNQSLKALPIKK